MSLVTEFLEDTLKSCGGLGRFQWLIIGSVLLGKICLTWSMLVMSFGGAIPNWSCHFTNNSAFSITVNVTTKTCQPPSNYSEFQCSSRIYDESMHTVVNEWDLVCDRDWITQTITTIQMAGLLVGGFAAGQIADTFGRKPTYFLSLFMLTIFNLIAAFSNSWQMFAALRFLIGVGSGFYLTVFFTFMVEFVSGKYRPMLSAIPSWAASAAVFGGLTCVVPNWKYLHIGTAAVAAPSLLTWWIVPESFRWLVSNNKIDKAEQVIKTMARINRKPRPDTSKLRLLAKMESNTSKRYTYWDILKNKELLKRTILLAVGWISCGYAYYAISFGVQQLSGSLCLNLFLLSTVEIPAQILTWLLNHYIGRKKTTILFFIIAALTGAIVGALQLTEIENKGQLINGFALTSKLGVAAGWAALILLTTESYPTVVRNVGYGIQNSVTRIGAMVAPQIVYLSQHVDGVMYFICGGVMLISALCTIGVPETGGKPLMDTIETKETREAGQMKNKAKYNEGFDATHM